MPNNGQDTETVQDVRNLLASTSADDDPRDTIALIEIITRP